MSIPNDNLPADTVKYCLFPRLEKNSIEELELIAENYIVKLSGFLAQYIWHDGNFHLHPVKSEIEGLPSHLQGLTYYGDNVEDEWFIMFLLLYLTQDDPDLVIKVEDADGEFLLIEAALVLPKWINPKTSTNRVYIYQNKLHIIPVAKTPGEITPIPFGVPLVSDAVVAVREFSNVSLCSDDIQDTINVKILGYPQRIKELHHRAHCFVPAFIATLLKSEPHYLPSAIKAFYLRDPLDLKVCKAMKYFPPETRVMTEIVFTRCLYAQLFSQKYSPDKNIGWNLPPSNHPHFKAYDLGMKLACGFEILASKVTKDQFDSTFSDDIDVKNDEKWKRFLSSLMKNNYFCGELEGSKLHCQLMSQAKSFYLSSFIPVIGDVLPGHQIMRLLRTLPDNYEEIKDSEHLLNPPDDDSWMDIMPEQLESILDGVTNKEANTLDGVTKNIPETLKSFLGQSSSFEGVDVLASERDGGSRKKQRVNLDAESFSEAVNNILDFRLPDSDGDEDSSSMSGYSDSDDQDDEIDLRENEDKTSSKMELDETKNVSDLHSYMEEMDRELAQTNVGNSFELTQPQIQERNNDPEDIDDEDDDFRPVDVDLTVLKNILESFESQNGLPGPAENLFKSIGIQLPRNSNE